MAKICANPDHDHTTTADREGNILDAPIPMTCNDCGVPTHYDEAAHYQHDDPEAEPCFLIPERLGSPCEWREQIKVLDVHVHDLIGADYRDAVLAYAPGLGEDGDGYAVVPEATARAEGYRILATAADLAEFGPAPLEDEDAFRAAAAIQAKVERCQGVQVRIRTSDADWATTHGVATEPGADGAFLVTVETPTVERLTFGPKRAEMVRFDLGADAPKDHPRTAMYPASYVVAG